MTNINLVLKKLSIVEEHASRVLSRCPATLPEFENSTLLQDAISLSLLVMIQEALDIAFHICADEKWQLPASNAESFEILAQHGVLTAAVALEMVKLASMRNRIAHGYASVVPVRLWNELPGGLDACKRFCTAIGLFATQG